jgi:hypothetical protein
MHAVPKLSSVTVHVDPGTHDGSDPHASLAHHDQQQPPRTAVSPHGHSGQ